MIMEQNISCETIPLSIVMQIEMRAAGRRKNICHRGTLCSKCLTNSPRKGQRYCKSCHNKSEVDRRARNRRKAA